MITVDASISKGTIFRLYYNANWKQPVALPVSAGNFTSYRFDIPVSPESLRFDFSEAPDAVAIVRKVTIQTAGGPSRVLNLQELNTWVQDKCTNTYDPVTNYETVRATSAGMFTMGVIRDNSTRPE